MITDHHDTAPEDDIVVDDFPVAEVRSKLDKQDASCSSLDGSSASKSDPQTIVIPSHWSQQTQSVINERKLNTNARSDIVRTLVTLVISQHGTNPTRNQVENVCRQLVLKYPFMRDDIGTGYVSYSQLG